jgi:hypothetical protein
MWVAFCVSVRIAITLRCHSFRSVSRVPFCVISLSFLSSSGPQIRYAHRPTLCRRALAAITSTIAIGSQHSTMSRISSRSPAPTFSPPTPHRRPLHTACRPFATCAQRLSARLMASKSPALKDQTRPSGDSANARGSRRRRGSCAVQVSGRKIEPLSNPVQRKSMLNITC